MSIQSIGSSTGYDAASMAQMIMKKIDTNSDGSISKPEFASALKSASSSSPSSQDSVNLFSSLDTNNNSSVSQTELESFLKKLSAATSSSGTNSSQGSAPAGGGPGGAGGVGAAGGTNSSSSTSGSSVSLNYDVRDTNQDGIVSPQEELAYEASHPNAASKSQNSNSNSNNSSNTNNSQYQNAISQYQQNGMGFGMQSGLQGQFSLSG